MNTDIYKKLNKEIDASKITKPYNFDNPEADAIFEEWRQNLFKKKEMTATTTRAQDGYMNNVANLNTQNSLLPYTFYQMDKIGYPECAYLATEPLIANFISKHTDSLLREGWQININQETENQDELLQYIEKRSNELNLEYFLREAITNSFIFGSAFIYFSFDTEDLSLPIPLKKEVISFNKLKRLQSLSPWGLAPTEVEMSNMLDKNYLKPKKWFVNGGNTVDSSRLYQFNFFEVVDLIKPIYNYGGVSLCQLLKEPISNAASARSALADVLLKYRMLIIKSDAVQFNEERARDQAQYLAKNLNNTGIALLPTTDDLIQISAQLGGTTDICRFLDDFAASAGRLPITLAYGHTPTGLNNTGEFDLKTYYNQVANWQYTKIKPFLEHIYKIFALEFGADAYPEVVFNKLDTNERNEQAEIDNKFLDIIAKAQDNQIMTVEQSVDYLKQKKVLDGSFELEDNGENDLDFELPIHKEDIVYE